MKVIFTIGHSVQVFSEFTKKLKDNQIDMLVDVRTSPYSRYCPQFNRNALSRGLQEENIQYLWKGNNLGGKGKNVDYDEAIDELVEMAKEGKKICVMCTEKDYLKCHRYEMLTPSFQERNVTINHIQWV